jgi:putative membrane protein
MLNILDHFNYKIPALKSTAHTLLGVALGLLLVYRTNASYDRYWEGRKAWGAIINATRNLMRFIRTYDSTYSLLPLANLLGAYGYALKQRLRGLEDSAEFFMLTRKQVVFVESCPNKPLAISMLVSAWMREHCHNVRIRIIEGYVGVMLDSQGALERIVNTPIPFSYVAQVHHILLLYLITVS